MSKSLATSLDLIPVESSPPLLAAPAEADAEDLGFPLIVKSPWGEERRDTEPDIIRDSAEETTELEAHDPFVNVSYVSDEVQLDDRNGAEIQGQTVLQCQNKTRAPRLLRVLMERRLCPVSELSGKALQRAFWDIFYSHYFLWADGHHHHDINPGNMMYYRTPSGDVKGVLIAVDLSPSTSTRFRNQERTGTMPFTAVELLADVSSWDVYPGYPTTRPDHRYRHDAESFFWAIVYIMHCCGANGKLDRRASWYQKWCGVDQKGCQYGKTGWLCERHIRSTPVHEQDRNWLVKVVEVYTCKWVDQRMGENVRKKRNVTVPETDLEEFVSLSILFPEEDKCFLEGYLPEGTQLLRGDVY